MWWYGWDSGGGGWMVGRAGGRRALPIIPPSPTPPPHPLPFQILANSSNSLVETWLPSCSADLSQAFDCWAQTVCCMNLLLNSNFLDLHFYAWQLVVNMWVFGSLRLHTLYNFLPFPPTTICMGDLDQFCLALP